MLKSYILLDRSGSMSDRWTEALSSINAYVKNLTKTIPNAEVTLAVFDHHAGLQFDVIRTQKASDWVVVSDKDASPRGGTPLFDSIGRIISLAEEGNSDKTVIVVMTDGHENNSTEVTKAQAKARIDKVKAKDWEVIFLGADFNAFAEAGSVGVTYDKTINMLRGQYMNTMTDLSDKTIAYATCDSAIEFSAADRINAGGSTHVAL